MYIGGGGGGGGMFWALPQYFVVMFCLTKQRAIIFSRTSWEIVHFYLMNTLREGTLFIERGGGGVDGLGLQRGGSSVKFWSNGGGSRILNL